MLNMKRRLWFPAVAAGALVVVSGGCATKKYVAKTVDPVTQRVSAVEKKTTDQGTQIEGLETEQSRAKERLGDLDNGVKNATSKAEDAGNRANQAASAAQTAQTQAAEAKQYAENRTNTIEKYIDARDVFKMSKNASVLFKFGRADLDDDAKAALDALANDAKASKRFVIEVQGFTDSVGGKAYNIELSERRAENVVRYLTTKHEIPLRSIHVLGLGSEQPVAENKTRDGRKQNRRVEVRIFAPEVDASSAVTAAQLR